MNAFAGPIFTPDMRRGSSERPQLTAARPAPYLRVPDRMLRAYAHDPLAVGVYIAVARLALTEQGPVPLSAADLAAWAGAEHTRDARLMRRIKTLLAEGWLHAEAGRAVKLRLTPAWAPELPWRLDMPQHGKPNAVRTCRIPLELLDTYLGRLDPRPGRRPALVTRYFDRPLLNLADLGCYALALIGALRPSERLRQLGLASDLEVWPPQPAARLIANAIQGALLLDDGAGPAQVSATIAGWRRLGYTGPPLAAANGSLSGSRNGSDSAPQRIATAATLEVCSSATVCAFELLDEAELCAPWESWEGSEESTNPPPLTSCLEGGWEDLHNDMAGHNHPGQTPGLPLDPAVRNGHQELNPQRSILPGEWLELERLQQQHGREPLLIWQARAARAGRDQERGIVPAYYVACAADQACAYVGQSLPSPEPYVSTPAELTAAQPDAPTLASVVASPPVVSQLDPASDALLRAMGVRRRSALAGVPPELIAAWHEAVQHPGMAARFTDPVAFAVSQMAMRTPPPCQAELERWAAMPLQGPQASGPQLIAPGEVALAPDEQNALAAQASRLLPAATAWEKACLISFFRQGATDGEALALLEAQRRHEAQLGRVDEVRSRSLVGDDGSVALTGEEVRP